MTDDELKAWRERFGGANEEKIHDAHFASVAGSAFNNHGNRPPPFGGISTFMMAPARTVDWSAPDLSDLDVAFLGAPMDLGVTNRAGTRFGPRAVRTIERIGPYNHALKVMPSASLRAADLGDVPWRGRYSLEGCHADIEDAVAKIVAAGVIPLVVGGDHSISHPVLRAVGADAPVGMIHIDAHCDTAGPFDDCKFHHGGPFRQAVLDGVLDPKRTIQIGIRGSSEYLWEFSYETGMTVIHAERFQERTIADIAAEARSVVGEGPVYVSFDIDSLDPAFAPGTGTPEVGGLTTREVQALLRALAGINMIGGDVVEVAPQYDSTTNTAHAGAQVLFELFSLLAVRPGAAA